MDVVGSWISNFAGIEGLIRSRWLSSLTHHHSGRNSFHRLLRIGQTQYRFAPDFYGSVACIKAIQVQRRRKVLRYRMIEEVLEAGMRRLAGDKARRHDERGQVPTS